MNAVHKESCIDAIDIAAKTCFSLHFAFTSKVMFILQTKSSKSLWLTKQTTLKVCYCKDVHVYGY